MICNSDSFTSSFPIYITFTSFSSSIAVVRTSKTVLNNSGESGHSCLLPDLRGNAFSFFFFKISFLFFKLFIYLFMAVLGLHFCARAFSSCGKQGPLFIAVRGPLTITASLVAEHRLQTHRLSNYGSRAQPLRGMWDLPRPGLEPVSPALAGGFLTTAPPGKPMLSVFDH